ncbi:MAG: hypothetical protein WB586_19190, partial [Chthoniobacterales bacterium]
PLGGSHCSRDSTPGARGSGITRKLEVSSTAFQPDWDKAKTLLMCAQKWNREKNWQWNGEKPSRHPSGTKRKRQGMGVEPRERVMERQERKRA